MTAKPYQISIPRLRADCERRGPVFALTHLLHKVGHNADSGFFSAYGVYKFDPDSIELDGKLKFMTFALKGLTIRGYPSPPYDGSDCCEISFYGCGLTLELAQMETFKRLSTPSECFPHDKVASTSVHIVSDDPRENGRLVQFTQEAEDGHLSAFYTGVYEQLDCG